MWFFIAGKVTRNSGTKTHGKIVPPPHTNIRWTPNFARHLRIHVSLKAYMKTQVWVSVCASLYAC